MNQAVVEATDATGNARRNEYGFEVGGTTASYTYDPAGFLTGRSEGGHNWGYEWNARGGLSRVTKDGAEVARYEYDPLGRRIQKVAQGITYSYVYDGMDILRETRSDGTTYTYIHGPSVDEPLARVDQGGQAVYYHADGLGSIVKMTNGAGQAVHSYQYDAWGNITQGVEVGGYAFTGREWDPETGLYYHRVRYYDPEIGRFISEDPIGLAAGPNQYSYVGDTPTRFIDPSGLMELPGNPSGLPPGWAIDPSHQYPGGERYVGPGGAKLDWHPGQPGEPGWGGRDHWHWIPPGQKKDPEGHREPGDTVPDLEEKCRNVTDPMSEGLAEWIAAYMLMRQMLDSAFAAVPGLLTLPTTPSPSTAAGMPPPPVPPTYVFVP